MKKLILKEGDILFDSALSQGQMQSVLGGTCEALSESGSESGSECPCNTDPANLACECYGNCPGLC